MTKYVRNEEGGVHSVSEEHFENVLHETTAAGRSYLLPGWEEISEAEARESHPQLFGVPDPQITFTDDELAREASRQRMLGELHGTSASGTGR